jgi:sugar O-acyltransferase (sialic acid O-acetyltransferase NeuD family)
MSEGMFVFGASGHAKVVIDAIERAAKSRVLFVCDDAPERHGTRVMGYPVIRGREELLARAGETRTGVVAIGDNAVRARVAAWLRERRYGLAVVVHPSAVIARDVEIGEGSVVMAGCVINTGARIGRNVIVNTGATVDHDCVIGDDSHIAPGAHLCGHVSVGAGSFLGAGTTVIPCMRIGARATIGAGSTVLQDIGDDARAGGTPCRPLGS